MGRFEKDYEKQGRADSIRRSPSAVRATFLLLCLLILLPAAVWGCAEKEIVTEKAPGEGIVESKAGLSFSGSDCPEVLDIFIYDDDGTGLLDSYRRYEGSDLSEVVVCSGAGKKVLAAIANHYEDYTVDQIGSFASICRMQAHLDEETVDRPVLSGMSRFEAGERVPVELKALSSEIIVGELSFDFKDDDLKGVEAENVKIYLTNVNASATLFRDSLFRASDVINSAGLHKEDMDRMKSPELVWWEADRPVGTVPIRPDAVFRCYPNDIDAESPGSQFTRLVVQADLSGDTCYYPLNVNRPGFGYSYGPQGLHRNVKYILNLRMTRRGSSDPDIPVGPEIAAEYGWLELHPGNYVEGMVGDTVRVWCEVYPDGKDVEFDREDLDYDVERGIYQYDVDPDGRGVTLTLTGRGTGMFIVWAGPPVSDGFLVVIVAD